MSKHGGRRRGSGRKKGTLNKKTIEEKDALEYLRRKILDNYEPIVDSMITAATGYYHQPEANNDDSEATRIYMIKPDAKIGKDLLEFVVGKAPQTINANITDPSGLRSIDALATTVKTILEAKAPPVQQTKPVESPVVSEVKEEVPVANEATTINPENILRP